MRGSFRKYVKIAIFLFVAFIGVFILIDYVQESKSLNKYRKELKDESFVQLSKGLTRYELNILDTTNIVLFIHGGGILGYEVFRKNIDALNDIGISTLAYDQYGRGYSDKPRIEYSSEELYTQLVELVDSLGLKAKKVSVVSLSVGSVIAWRFMKGNPDIILNNIFISPSLFKNSAPGQILQIPGLNYLLMTFYWHPQYIEKRRREFYNQDSYNKYVTLINHFSSFGGFKRIYLSTWLNIMSEGLNPDELKPSDKGLLKNAFFVFGDHDPFFGVGYRDVVTNMIGDEKLFVIDKAGHMPNFERDDKINELLIGVLGIN